MPSNQSNNKKHIILSSKPTSESFTPRKGFSKELDIYTQQKDRAKHGREIKKQLELIQSEISKIKSEQEAEYSTDYGNVIVFESGKNYELKVESLDVSRNGIELLNIKKIDDVEYATVYIPEGKIQYFIKKVENYLSENTKKNRPSNNELIGNISKIKLAILESFWTDLVPFNELNKTEERWLEIWVRTGKEKEEKEKIEKDFKAECKKTRSLLKVPT